jgi:long-chain acyl-CoA synthetase
VAPAPIEMKLSKNQHIEQICVVGANLPQPIALVVLSADSKAKDWSHLKESLEATLQFTNSELEKHERLQKLIVVKDDWTVENGLLTPTLKIKRGPIEDRYHASYTYWYGNADAVVRE